MISPSCWAQQHLWVRTEQGLYHDQQSGFDGQRKTYSNSVLHHRFHLDKGRRRRGSLDLHMPHQYTTKQNTIVDYICTHLFQSLTDCPYTAPPDGHVSRYIREILANQLYDKAQLSQVGDGKRICQPNTEQP